MFDVVLEGGWVVDGSGAPPYRADVALTGDRIAAIGALAHAESATRVSCLDRYDVRCNRVPQARSILTSTYVGLLGWLVGRTSSEQ